MSEIKDRLAQLTPQQKLLLQKQILNKQKQNGRTNNSSALTNNQQIIKPMLAADRARPQQLAPVQQKIWFFEKLQPDEGIYNLTQNFSLQGDVDYALLQQGFQIIIQRHDALRTQFFEKSGEPWQSIVDKVDFKLQHTDLSQLTEEQQAQQQAAIIQAEASFAFDLETAPLLRVHLIKQKSERHVLLIVVHHIISDGWSIGVLLNEFALLYNQLSQQQTIKLADPQLQFSDIVNWQIEKQQSTEVSSQLTFWEKSLAGTSGLLELPTDKARTNQLALNGARENFSIDSELLSSLNQLAKTQNSTLFMLLLAAFQTLLSRYTGQQDIIVGSPLANRSAEETQDSIGLLMNTLALRGDLSGDPSFRELIDRTRNFCLDAFDNADLPLEKIIERLKPERVPGRTPLFQTMFVMQNSSGDQLKLNGLTLEEFNSDMSAARFEITLSLMVNQHDIAAVIDYNCDLFDAVSIQRLTKQFCWLLKSIVYNPDKKISQLSLLSPKDIQSLLQLGNGGESLVIQDKASQHNLFALIQSQAKLTPDAIAIIDLERQVSYQQLIENINGVAQQLTANGSIQRKNIALLADRSIESLVGLLAILACGAAYVPLDSSAPDQRIQFVLQDAEIAIIVTPPKLLERAHGFKDDCRICLSDTDLTLENSPDCIIQSADTAYIIYTSGSTGQPKGVVVTHHNALNLVSGFIQRHDFNNQRLLMIPPIIFDASVGDIFPILAVGSTLVLHPTPTELGAVELQDFCQRYKISAIDAPAALWRRWTEGLLQQDKSQEVLADLRLMMFGGEAVPMEQVRKFARLTSNRVTLCNHYGPTETSVCAAMLETVNGAELACNENETNALETNQANNAELPIGRPLPGVQLYITDQQNQLVPRGAIGELCIGGVGVTQGYLNNVELTQQQFVADHFSHDPAAKLYRTGDLARWNNNGTLQFIGRVDHQIKLRGIRIELGEIETAIASFNHVQHAIVQAQATPAGDKRLVGYFTASQTLDIELLRDFLSQTLPDAMVPTFFQQLESFELTSNGKIARNKLPKLDLTLLTQRKIDPPVNEVQRQIFDIWQTLLGHSDLSIDDEFFNVGGDSLLTLPLVFKLKEAFAIDVPLTAVFISPTISGLAKVVEQLQSGDYQENFDLASHVILPDDIDPANALPVRTARNNPNNILITGATGFLGAYLVRELLDATQASLTCLVRADDLQLGFSRIKKNLQNYSLWQPEDETRLVPLLGDLGSPAFGLTQLQFDQLADEVDLIFHNGGQVNFLAPYENLAAVNVEGTVEVLRLACRKWIKPVHMVSTLGIYLSDFYLNKTVRETEAPPGEECQHGGYNQSKWVGEQIALLARSKGLPLAIYRPARITGDSKTGSSNLGDYFNSWIKGCVQLGMAPDVADNSFDMAPVDYVAKAIVKLALVAGEQNSNYHFLNPHRLPATKIFSALAQAGINVEPVEYSHWRTELQQSSQLSSDNALSVFASIFPENPDSREPVFDCSLTEQAIAMHGIVCPPADEKLFSVYLDFMLQNNFLDVSNHGLPESKTQSEVIA